MIFRFYATIHSHLSENVPGGQSNGTYVPFAQYFPAGQIKNSVIALLGQYPPGGHSKHSA